MRELTKEEQSQLLDLYDDLYRWREGEEWRKARAPRNEDKDFLLFQECYNHFEKERKQNRLERTIRECERELKSL